MRMIDANTLREVVISFQYTPTSNENERCVRAIDSAPTVEMPGWISRKDKLPDKDGVYLTLTYDALGQAYPQIGMYRDGEWLWCAYVYYWMPIPKAPEPPEEVLDGQ